MEEPANTDWAAQLAALADRGRQCEGATYANEAAAAAVAEASHAAGRVVSLTLAGVVAAVAMLYA
jgi:hypothetical protein